MVRFKKTFLVLLLVFSLLLCGCSQDPPVVEEPAEETLFTSSRSFYHSPEFYWPYVITLEIPTTHKISIEFLFQLKIGLINTNSYRYAFQRTIKAEGFEISTPFDISVKDFVTDDYYDVRSAPYYIDVNSVDETTKANYTEMITFKMYDMTPRSGSIFVGVESGDGDYKWGDFNVLKYATDGEYIAFSLESQEAAQAMLDK